jgi:hypothetical protein
LPLNSIAVGYRHAEERDVVTGTAQQPPRHYDETADSDAPGGVMGMLTPVVSERMNKPENRAAGIQPSLQGGTDVHSLWG